MVLLVIGGTGTLGRQIVRRALNEGFQVRCLVRSFRRAAFLKEWGAELIYGDLLLPETIPLTLLGVSGIIDCSTSRPDDLYNIELVDLKSKYILIESAIRSSIKRYVFFSIVNSSDYTNVPLIKLKIMIENRLKSSGLNYTIFNLHGFFQGLIPQYAVPILDKKPIWITSETSNVRYINTQDIARIVVQSLSIKQFNNNVLPIVGNQTWRSTEIISLCEKISGRVAQTNKIPIYLLKSLKNFLKFFQWTWNISDRLAFIEILSKEYKTNTDMKEILYLLQMNRNELEELDLYFQEYFICIMKKIKEFNYQTLNNIQYNDERQF